MDQVSSARQLRTAKLRWPCRDDEYDNVTFGTIAQWHAPSAVTHVHATHWERELRIAKLRDARMPGDRSEFRAS
jgi:hypothetical protein